MMKKVINSKYTLYMLGLLIFTLGISTTIQSKLGTAPFDALLVGLSIKIGLSVGSWEIILALIMISMNAMLTKERPEIFGLFTAFITGFGIDMWLFILHYLITPHVWLSKFICFGVGLLVIGLGTSIYLQSNLALNPIDRLTLIIQELTSSSILFSRTVIYLFFLIMAYLFNGPIGIGTVLTVCLGGIILNFFMPITDKVLVSISSHYTT